jgi:hypothetical protein
MRISEIINRPRTRSGPRDPNHARPRSDADERAYHAAFKPYLRCETEHDVPQPIFIAAMLGVTNLRVVQLPRSAWTAPEDRRDEIVKAAIHDHYRRTGGRVPAFGQITGYSLVLKAGQDADLALPFDTRGHRVGPMRSVPRLGEATLSVDGQRLSRSIWRDYGRYRR